MMNPHGHDTYISGDHKTQLISDGIHAGVVLIVVMFASILTAVHTAVPPDVLGTVYGGAIGYAAGRAGNIQRARSTALAQDYDSSESSSN